MQNGVYSSQMLASVALPVQKFHKEWFVIAMYCSDSGHVNVSVKVASLFVVVSSPPTSLINLYIYIYKYS